MQGSRPYHGRRHHSGHPGFAIFFFPFILFLFFGFKYSFFWPILIILLIIGFTSKPRSRHYDYYSSYNSSYPKNVSFPNDYVSKANGNFCKNCGYHIEQDSLFCSECGQKLS